MSASDRGVASRVLGAGQRCVVTVVAVSDWSAMELFETRRLLVEAPTWWAAGEALLLNADGGVWRLSLAGDAMVELNVPGLPDINNDHVLHPDGQTLLVSGNDGHLYAAPTDGGPARRLTAPREGPDEFRHYLHGVSPDGSVLSYTGLGWDGRPATMEQWLSPTIYDIHRTPAGASGEERLTFGPGASDGAEFSPDGEWLYFNTEMFSSEPGHAQIARMRPDGSGVEQLTFDAGVNWFPHLSPVGGGAVYLSYPSGTLGHPADRVVELRHVERDWSRHRVVARFTGGQGTINVNSWSPDGTKFAYVAYPFDGDDAAEQGHLVTHLDG